MKTSEHTLVALLPIKADSRRVPQKNFKEFAGRPLFQWILDTLLSIDLVERIIINTDAKTNLILHGLPTSHRIVLRERAPHLCGDMISMNAILADDIAHIHSRTYLMTHTTNPLLQETTIRAALTAYEDALRDGSGDSLFTVNRVQGRFYTHNGSAINHDPRRLLRTQDLEPWYEENSNLYFFSAESFEDTASRIGRHPILFETARIESIDIDDYETWTMAEALAIQAKQLNY